jgi:hypothetical protein
MTICRGGCVGALFLAVVEGGCPVAAPPGGTSWPIPTPIVVASEPSSGVGSHCVCDEPHVPGEGRAPSGAPYGLPYNPTVSTVTTSLAQVFTVRS